MSFKRYTFCPYFAAFQTWTQPAAHREEVWKSVCSSNNTFCLQRFHVQQKPTLSTYSNSA